MLGNALGNAIEISGARKTFGQKEPVLKNVALEIRNGEIVALIGPSGSGKSTLIRIIAGLERIDRNSAGAVSLFGQVTQRNGRTTPEQRLMRREISVIFQQFNLVSRLSLLTNVLVGRLGRVSFMRGTFGVFSKADKVTALNALDRVGMLHLARQRASTLSGGQQQRGAIARALTQEAQLILADEPIASLDPASAETVMETLSSINREEGVTVLISLHQIDHAFKYCTRIVALKDGEVIFDGPTNDIAPEDLADLYGIEGLELAHGPRKPVDGAGSSRMVAGDSRLQGAA